MAEATHPLKRLTPPDPIPDDWYPLNDPVEDTDGGRHIQWYRHKIEDLVMIVMFPCGVCGGDVRYVMNEGVAWHHLSHLIVFTDGIIERRGYR